MEEAIEEISLLQKRTEEEEIEEDNNKISWEWEGFFEEAKKIASIGAPMAAAVLSQYLLQLVTLMIVGHIGKLALSAAAFAISLAAVTGFSLHVGLASALETLSGQAYGAQQYQRLGNHTSTSIFCLLVVCIPLTLVWIFMGKILVFVGQDPQISHEAGKFMIWLIPALFAHAFLQPLLRFFQTQSLMYHLLISSWLAFALHIPLCWALVYKTELKNLGGALAMSISTWFNVILLLIFMRFSSACAATRAVISMELFRGIREFFRFAIPSAVMACLSWWSYEIIILLAGFLPNPQLETSVLSICFNTLTTIFTIAYGIGVAGSTRVSNELGAGRPRAARLAASAVVFFAVVETVIVSGGLFSLRRVYGYAFGSEKEVINYIDVMTPLVCTSVVLDGIQAVLTGVARGCGWQHIGASINLVAFYLCGIPTAAILGFCLKLRGKGLWIGIQLGVLLQTILLFVVTSRIDWRKQATQARERIFYGRDSVY